MSDLSTAASLPGEVAGPGTALPVAPTPRTAVRGRSVPGWTAGLDIGGTKVLATLVDPDGASHEAVRIPTTLGPEGVVRSAVRAIGEVARRVGADPTTLEGVGIGVPGLVDPEDGSVTHAVNLGIEGGRYPLAEHVSREIGGVPVRTDNDLNVAALGASHLRGADGSDLAFLALGTGLAAGIVLGGELRRGVSGAAGEIGHIPIDPRGPLCACGQRGCVEVYASGSALSARWPSRHGRPAPAELFEAAAAGDVEAQRIKDEFASAVASAVRILELTVDVRHVVLGGGVSALGEPLLDAVRAALVAQSRTSPFLSSLQLADRVSLAPHDVPVAAVGAALVGRRKEF
ncbi:ROK family protein [Cellulosimicrobium marinum]|uniref:ROK family protein n=1 Tax=Cellulosimicrobium marinum TaxID=1638992 RepID=UPI001E5EA74C|nr:ROK family protein [Cellulosimicrobium marinum]MCB7136428.1 ROK family protein [Cellulosimicrobium marinum]